MVRFILQRTLLAIASFIGVTLLIWYFGVSGLVKGGTFHPDFQAHSSYIAWIIDFLHGDWGSLQVQHFMRNGLVLTVVPVLPIIQSFALTTLLLLIPAFILQEVLAFTSGVLTAVRPRSIFDNLVTGISFTLMAAPSFLVGLIAIEYLAILNHWLPGYGLYDYQEIGAIYGSPQFWAFVHQHTLQAFAIFGRHMLLPILALTITTFPPDSQLIRVSMLEVLSQDYIRAARAHGVPQRRIIWQHALRNALLPILTQLGTQVPRLIFTGALIEFVFNLPGIGTFFCTSIFSIPQETPTGSIVQTPRQIGPVIACMMLFVILTILASLLTDITYSVVDPRVREGER